ncbi:MAG TPA: hypothetical protein VHC43_14675 [Mycobacteriales bacterium]|nr:hypothetical protein [Mycobacteriales bacterium]
MATQDDFAALWRRIVLRVAEIAPGDAAEVGDPDASGLAELARAFGGAVPSDVVAYFSTVPRTPPHVRLLPFHSALVPGAAAAELRMRREIEQQVGTGELEPDAGDMAWAWGDAFIPLSTDTMGNTYFVDLRPGPMHGCIKEYDHEQGALYDPEWPSLEAMLEAVASALETGGVVGDGRPDVDDGRLDWTPVSAEQ